VTGRVSDPSGAAVSGAHVSAFNELTDQSVSADTGPDGSFSIELPPATYRIIVSAAEFERYTLSSFALTVGASRSLDVTLQPPHPTMARPPSPLPRTAGDRPPTAAARAPSVSGRSFLAGADSEEPGYGLYSYLLFGTAPGSEDEKQRDLAVIQAFVKLLNDVSDLQSQPGMTKSDINVTYLLVADRPPEKLPSPDWILSHYDFPRAKVLLRVFNRDVFGGPYVASSLTPLSQSDAAPEHYLWQDMSHVPAALAGSWEEEFERRARKSDFWALDKRNQEILGLRDFISNAATGLAAVNIASADFKTMLGGWLSWK
jgi:hypothetical protein